MKRLTLITINVLLFIGAAFAYPDTNEDPIRDYKEALEIIRQMLEGEIKPCFKDAVFTTENAYLGGKLNYFDYMANLGGIINDVLGIRENINFSYEYIDKRDVYTNAALFQYFTDTIEYQDSTNTTIDYRYPYQYNFDDALGVKDWSNMFVSKLITTNKGNCHSLPYLYQIIANEFKVNSHLAIAPNHLYITHLCHDPKITWYNSELTSGTHPIDGWIKVQTYMTMESIRSGIYGLPLDEKQSIALTLVDLANGYIRKLPDADKTLAIECLDLALKHFPNCINAMLLKLDLLASQWQISKDKDIKQIIDQLAAKIHRLGFDEMPRQMYLDWIDGKKEFDPTYKPFEEINNKVNQEYNDIINKPLLTASNGRYLEYHFTDSLELIGRILYDTKRKEVAKFLAIDTSDLVLKIPRDILSRWLSPDPLASKYPSISPYAFTGNNPIKNVEVDGRYFVDANGERINSKHIKLKRGKIVVAKHIELGKDMKEIIRLANHYGSSTANDLIMQGNQSLGAIHVDIIEERPDVPTFIYPDETALEFHAPHDSKGKALKWDRYGKIFTGHPEYIDAAGNTVKGYATSDNVVGYKAATIQIFKGNIETEGVLKEYSPGGWNAVYDRKVDDPQEAIFLNFIHSLKHNLDTEIIKELRDEIKEFRTKPHDPVKRENAANEAHNQVIKEIDAKK